MLPASLYLAAAGVGTIGIIDFDVVDLSNLQRQIVHTTDRVGEKKVDSARKTLNALNPDVKVVAHEEMLVADNVDRIIAGYDVVLDGTDTFETRYILNDAAVAAGIPVVHASVFRFEGQLTTFVPYEGPCYRCLYPTPPPPELAPGCSVAGVLGVVPGIMGLLQANEVLKLLLGIGETLAGRLLLFDALETEFTELRLRRDPECPVCSDKARAAREAGHAARRVATFSDGVFTLGAAPAGAAVATPLGGVALSTVKFPGGAPGERRRRARGRGVGVDDRRGARHARRDLPVAQGPAVHRGRRAQPVRQRLRERPGRALSRRPGDVGGRGGRGQAAAGDGGRGATASTR